MRDGCRSMRLWRSAAFFLPEIILVVARIVVEHAVFDLEDARGQLVDEVAVVGDEDDRAGVVAASASSRTSLARRSR